MEHVEPCRYTVHHASVFIIDDEYSLHQDYGKWLEELPPHTPIRQYRHNDTGEDACPRHRDRLLTLT